MDKAQYLVKDRSGGGGQEILVGGQRQAQQNKRDRPDHEDRYRGYQAFADCPGYFAVFDSIQESAEKFCDYMKQFNA